MLVQGRYRSGKWWLLNEKIATSDLNRKKVDLRHCGAVFEKREYFRGAWCGVRRKARPDASSARRTDPLFFSKGVFLRLPDASDRRGAARRSPARSLA